MPSQSPSVVRKCSNIPEMAEAYLCLFGAKLVGMAGFMSINSISGALLPACGFCLLCYFPSGCQSCSEKVPVLSESIQSLDVDTILRRIDSDSIDLLFHSSQEFETLGIIGGHGNICAVRLWMV